MQLNQIALQVRMISLESANPTQSLEALNFRLPAVFDGVVGFFKGLFTEREVSLKKVDPRPVMRLLNTVPYEEMVTRPVFVPPGMNTHYANYITHLVNIQENLDTHLLSKLDEYSKWIGTLLSKPELLASITGKGVDVQSVLTRIGDGYKEGKDYLSNGTVTERTFGEVFGRSADWVIVCNTTNDLIDRLSKLDRRRVMRTLEDLNVLLSTLTTRIKEDPQTYTVSGKQLESLSSGIYDLGRLVEAYSIQTYAVASVAKSLSDSSDWLVNGK